MNDDPLVETPASELAALDNKLTRYRATLKEIVRLGNKIGSSNFHVIAWRLAKAALEEQA